MTMVGIYRIMAGNKARKQAKKHLATSRRALRKAAEEGESYAAVTKLFGGAQCEVMGIDGVPKQCIIRNKFRGRGRRDNFIAPGTWCLVGARDWQRTSAGKRPVVDLLHVYSADHKELLQREVSAPWAVLLAETQIETTGSICFSEESGAAADVLELTTEVASMDLEDDLVDVDDI